MTWDRLETIWRGAWKPPEKLKPSDWAEKNLRLARSVSAEAGPIRLSRTPYIRGIIDEAVEPVVEEIVFVSGTQVGKTTAQEIMVGFWIDVDPGPLLIVKPSEAATEECVKERLRPLLDSSPALSRHKSPSPHDNTLSGIRLDTMNIYLGWAGSPQSLASRPCRYVLPDECDKFPPFSGREADPMSLARERMATYLHRRRMFNASTPTTRDGAIWRAFEGCGDKRRFHVPCPHCKQYQLLTWPQVKWPKLDIADKVKRADVIERDRLAWYECSNPLCRGRIEESHKPKMLEKGVWISYDSDEKPMQSVDESGVVRGDRPISKRVGFHLSSLYSPWRTFAEMAAEFIRSEGDIAATMNFRNSRLAEPFENQVSKREPHKIREKEQLAKTYGIAGKARIVPRWGIFMLALVDVQKDHVYWQIDVWGYEMRSKRIAVGIAATLEEAYLHAFAPPIPFVNEDGVPAGVQEMVIDSGYRKDEVTEFAKREPQRIRLAKGMSTYFGSIADPKVEKASGVLVWNINTMQSKDTLDRLIGDPDQSRWQVYDGMPEEYAAQLTSEHKILDPQTKRMEWKEKSSGAANHWWDCSAMSCAVASAKGAAMPESSVQSKPAQVRSSVPDWVGEFR